MSKRIDRQYLQPQIKIFENALIEWTVLFIVFLTPFVIEQNGDDHSISGFVIGFIFYYVIFGLMYLVPRTTISSYLAMRRVVMEDNG